MVLELFPKVLMEEIVFQVMTRLYLCKSYWFIYNVRSDSSKCITHSMEKSMRGDGSVERIFYRLLRCEPK